MTVTEVTSKWNIFRDLWCRWHGHVAVRHADRASPMATRWQVGWHLVGVGPSGPYQASLDALPEGCAGWGLSWPCQGVSWGLSRPRRGVSWGALPASLGWVLVRSERGETAVHHSGRAVEGSHLLSWCRPRAGGPLKYVRSTINRVPSSLFGGSQVPSTVLGPGSAEGVCGLEPEAGLQLGPTRTGRGWTAKERILTVLSADFAPHVRQPKLTSH